MSFTDLKKKVDEILDLVDCYIIFNSDRHLNEYINDCDKKVYYLSSFNGSNGTLVLCKEPVLITDSRYYIEAANTSKYPLWKDTAENYILSKGYKTVSFDLRTISSKRFDKLMKFFVENNINFVKTDFLGKNEYNFNTAIIDLEQYYIKDYLKTSYLIKNFDKDQNDYIPDREYEDLDLYNYLKEYDVDYSTHIAGESYMCKITRIQELANGRTIIISELDTIAWILNYRGSDIEYNPVFYSYLIIGVKDIILFTNKSIERKNVQVKPYSMFESYLKSIEGPIYISGSCNQCIYSIISETPREIEYIDSIRIFQSTKNKMERVGMTLAYFYDAIALVELFAYLKNNNSDVSEKKAADLLNKIKGKFNGYYGPSFETISCTGKNSAIVHHKPSHTIIDKNNVYLIDSGSHYYFGTTDTTRTLFFGSKDMCPDDLIHDYTLVLKGQINAMMYRYSADDKYSKIDEIARSFLKAEGKDFGHSTGHGVGHFLCVHEAPPSIHPKGDSSTIFGNQVFSVEPGFYKENFYGIRIENLVLSNKLKDNTVELRNLTLVPYQNMMVDIKMLSAQEIEYCRSVNALCLELIGKYLSKEALDFLKSDCL